MPLVLWFLSFWSNEFDQKTSLLRLHAPNKRGQRLDGVAQTLTPALVLRQVLPQEQGVAALGEFDVFEEGHAQ